MLIEPNKNNLGDRGLDEKEAVLKIKQENRNLTAKYRIPGQAELEDQERSIGPRMQAGEFISRLRRCNPGLHFLDGTPGNIALYILRNRLEREQEFDPAKSQFFNDNKYVGGFPLEPLPEYSHVTLDARGLPKREVRGWRSILIALIKSKVITYRAAVKQFGEATGPRSDRWHQQLQKHK